MKGARKFQHAKIGCHQYQHDQWSKHLILTSKRLKGYISCKFNVLNPTVDNLKTRAQPNSREEQAFVKGLGHRWAHVEGWGEGDARCPHLSYKYQMPIYKWGSLWISVSALLSRRSCRFMPLECISRFFRRAKRGGKWVGSGWPGLSMSWMSTHVWPILKSGHKTSTRTRCRSTWISQHPTQVKLFTRHYL